MSIMSTGGGDLERRMLRVGAVGYTVDEVARMLRISRNAVYFMPSTRPSLNSAGS
jgi:hypothetical protein